MLRSRFCLYPRVVEAIYAESVPVILSNSYVIPFSDVLNWDGWDGFTISVAVSEILRLKEILNRVSEDEYYTLKAWREDSEKTFYAEPAR